VFTYNKQSFPDLKEFIEELHSQSMHYIPILDAGVAKRENQNYTAYESGVKQDVFIKTEKGENFVGLVWPGDAVFPDFFNNGTSNWWQS
jgi:alpha-glucosidase (family GH31 glycosyl hydrolase)